VRLFEAGKSREAKTVFEPAFKANTRDAAAAFYLGRIAMEERKNDRAADYFETATKLDPKNTNVLPLAWPRVRARGSAGECAASAWSREAHASCVGARHRARPGDLDARSDLIQYYVQAPGFMAGSTTKALEQAEEDSKAQRAARISGARSAVRARQEAGGGREGVRGRREGEVGPARR
jgi:tetratricopeptide (TPR) repeat protein